MLFRVWNDSSHRPTRDVDFLGYGPAETKDLGGIFHELCSLPVEPDGLIFLPLTVNAQPIREEARAVSPEKALTPPDMIQVKNS